MSALWVGAAVFLCATRCNTQPSGPRPDGKPPETQPAAVAYDEQEFHRLLNLARAKYESKSSADAIAALSKAVAMRADIPAVRIDLALAYLPARDTRKAMAELDAARKLAPDSVPVAYLTGVTYLRDGKYRQAIPHLERAVRQDPNTSALRYQLAAAYRGDRRDDEAAVQLRAAVRIDPRHATAQLQLAMYARRTGNTEEANRRFNEAARIRRIVPDTMRTPEALEKCRYTRMHGAAGATCAPLAVPVRFADATSSWIPDALGAAPSQNVDAGGVAFVDTDGDGVFELLITDAAGRVHLLRRAGATRFIEDPDAIQAHLAAPVSAVVVGDYNNDGTDDVFVLSETHATLLEGAATDGAAGFIDVTEKARLAAAAGGDAAWIDYDHDGDLDLLVVGLRANGTGLYQNRGDGTFRPAPDAAFSTELIGVHRVATADRDTDDDLDIYLAATDGLRILRNLGEGHFEQLTPEPRARACAVDDLDHDGEPDAVTADEGGGSVMTAAGRRRPLPHGVSKPSDVLLLDYDNDGWTDALIVGAGDRPLSLWRNEGATGWRDVTAEVSLPAGVAPVTRAAAADVDDDGDTDLLLATAAGPKLLRNDGGNTHRQLKVRLTGSKTNRTGLGADVEVRAGSFRASRFVNRLPIEIGVASRAKLDTVRVVWTNGIVQHRIDVAVDPAHPLHITEKAVQAGSCPFLYAWDGHGFRFVTDLLGVSPLGLSAARGVYVPADTDELVKIGEAAAFPPRDGKYVVLVTDEMREILFLDRSRLLVVDRRPEEEVHATDKVMMPPFPPSKVWWLSRPHAIRRAENECGDDVTAALRAVDGQRVGATRLREGQLRGITRPTRLTLAFGEVGPLHRPVLVLTGWLRWGDASVNVSLGQRAERLGRLPQLEIRRADGSWQRLSATVGAPAGKTKTILCDLTDALAGHTGELTLRMRSDLELYWDRIVLMEQSPEAATVHWLDTDRATLRFRGFSARTRSGPDAPEVPDPARVSPRPPWRRTLAGLCTRYGDVADLLRAGDNRMAILNAGDALEIAFPSHPLPPVPPGRVREFFLYSVGWDKDGDYNVAHNQTVDPLPFHGMDAGRYGAVPFPWTPPLEKWAEVYNIRWTGNPSFRR